MAEDVITQLPYYWGKGFGKNVRNLPTDGQSILKYLDCLSQLSYQAFVT